ncbi:hypothetical protein Tco_0030986 [Tanacetum coccineum]
MCGGPCILIHGGLEDFFFLRIRKEGTGNGNENNSFLGLLTVQSGVLPQLPLKHEGTSRWLGEYELKELRQHRKGKALRISRVYSGRESSTTTLWCNVHGGLRWIMTRVNRQEEGG